MTDFPAGSHELREVAEVGCVLCVKVALMKASEPLLPPELNVLN